MNSTGDRKTCENAAGAVLPPLPPGVTPGAVVAVRGARWRLEAVVSHADCRELHLQGGSPAARRVLLWPPDRPVAAEKGRRFTSVRLRTWAESVGAALAGTIDRLTPRVRVCRAAILPYQLAPAISVARGAARLMLADEVGLGKTIQAGWIVADLVEREPAARVLVAVPAALRQQWCGELLAQFDITATLVDARWLRGMVAGIPAGISPWTAPGVYLGSVDFLKRPDVASSLEAHVWDLVVADEAHTAVSPTDRYAALAAVASHARRIVTITATPYSGDTAGFSSMAALGAAAGDPPPLMFRRSREDVGDPRRRRHRFTAVRITRAETRLQRLLERYSRNVWRNAPADVEGARLAMTVLRKRALSSPAAAARSLRRRLDLLQAPDAAGPPRQLSLFDDDDEVGDELPEGALGAPGLGDAALEQRWLTVLIEAADAASALDSKARCLRRLLDRTGREPVIVFTEYRDTLLQLASTLPPALQLHGGLTVSEREAVQASFNETGGLLLATDAAAEGLNLQRRCRIVVNYELPWNPARLEQRIGRVDRIGQHRAVHALSLVARDTAEDLVIANLLRRLARVVSALGQRDRLGALLTEARTARMVIGGAPADEPEREPDGPAVCLEPAIDDDARAAADRLGLRGVGKGGMSRPQHASSAVAVSTLRASPALGGGFAVAVRCTARNDEGGLIAERAVLVHVRGDIARPPTREAARSMAAEVTSALPDVRDACPDLAAWCEAVAETHERAIDRRIARETALLARSSEHAHVQPGLFDRRLERAARQVSAAERAVHAEHRRHIAALDRGRRVGFSCTPIAVLIVWR